MDIEQLFSELDNLSDRELARGIANAGSNESRFIFQVYLLRNREKSLRVQTLLDQDSELHGTLLGDY